jgi:hypothetical protein
MMRAVKRVVALLIVTMGIPQVGFSQATPHLQDFFRQSIGFVLLTISTVVAHFRPISRSAYSAALRSFLT